MATARMVAVDVETWVDGSLVGGFRKHGPSIEDIRERHCPKDLGWEHVIEENTLAAKRDNKTYLFVIVQD